MVGWTRRPLAAIGVGLVALWVSRLLRVRRSVERHRQWWAAGRGEPDGLLYVALGDSAAQGVGASRPERGYVSLVAEQLRAATGRPVRVVNLSVSGATTVDLVRDQLPQLRHHHPDLLTVGIGGNDIWRYDAETYRSAVEELVAGLPDGAVLADVPYFMHGRPERSAEEAAAVLRAAGERRGLTVAPLHEAMQVLGWRAMATNYAADFFHPNDRGYRVWADAFWSVIAPRALAADFPLSRRASPTGPPSAHHEDLPSQPKG